MKIESYAVVDSKGKVKNVIAWDSVEKWSPPKGSSAVKIGDSGAGIGWDYVDGAFIPPPEPELSKEDCINKAESEKQYLLSYADSVFLEWQTKLLLNIASDDEKQNLILWVKYKDAVRAVNTDQAPNITWPEQPPIPENAQ